MYDRLLDLRARSRHKCLRSSALSYDTLLTKDDFKSVRNYLSKRAWGVICLGSARNSMSAGRPA